MLKRLLQLSSVVVLSLACVACNAEQPQPWVGTWATATMQAQGNAMRAFTGETLREIVHISAGGPKVRVRFTNEFGTDPLTIADAHVALSAGGGAVKPGSDHKLTFGGQTSIRIAPGAAMYSDAADLDAPALSDLAISFYVPNQVVRSETYHSFADQTNYEATGDQAGAETLAQATTMTSWYFVSGVDVQTPAGGRSIVTLGDPITDGSASTINTNRRWPDVLAARLAKTPGFEHVGVLNVGIGGNRVLNEGAGPSAVARFDRDVLAQNGVKYLMILESINDIGRLNAKRKAAPEDEITAADLELALGQIAALAHARGIKVYGATLTPYGGAGYESAEGHKTREAVNNWIRTSGTFDAVVDFEKVTSDGATPPRYQPAFDAGDHLHPSDAGYKAMGESIDLNLFK